jgi:signal transduction histidine kinase
MSNQSLNFFLIASTVALLLISIGLIVFVTYFFKAKKKAILAEQANKLRYEQNLSHTKVEVRAQTLGYISRELHDNVGQLLSVAKLSVGHMKPAPSNAQELNEILDQTATEVRSISHSLSAERHSNFSLIDALQKEVARIEKIGLIQFTINIEAYHAELDADQEVILFRIIQEFIANSLKHSEASQLSILIQKPEPHSLELSLSDNGMGYDTDQYAAGSGLLNMHTRAEMLQAKLVLSSTPQGGTQLILSLPIQTQ